MKNKKLLFVGLLSVLLISCGNSPASTDFKYDSINVNNYNILLNGEKDIWSDGSILYTHDFKHFYGSFEKEGYEYVYIYELEKESNGIGPTSIDIWPEEIGGVLFIFVTTYGVPKVFTDKGIYSIKEAYELGILNVDDLEKINKLYIAYYGEQDDPRGN